MLMPCILMLALLLITKVHSEKYEFLPDYDKLFDDCKDPSPPPGSHNMHGLFNMSEMEFNYNNDGITVSGNVTTVWDVKPTDRVAATAYAYEYKVGVWQPTLFNIKIPSLCDVMYQKSGLCYSFWTKHITNDVKKECINTPGTKMIHETFDLEIELRNIVLHDQGLYKIQITMIAYDENNVQRPIVICGEVRGQIHKI